MATNRVYQRPTWLYPKQVAAIFPAEQNTIVEASTKSGKTVGAIARLVEKALIRGREGRQFWWVAPVYAQSRIAFRRTQRALRNASVMAEINKTRMEILLTNGAMLAFKSGENADNLYGEDVYDAIVDEATRLHADAWYALQSTLTATDGSCCVIGNVTDRRNWAYDMARQAEAGHLPGWHYAKITAQDAIDAGVLKPEVIEAKRRLFPEAVFMALYFCQPDEEGGNPFGLAKIAACIRPLSDGDPTAWGWDLAKTTDYTVGLALDAANTVCRHERWNMHELPPGITSGQGYWEATEDRITACIGRALPVKIDATGAGGPPVERIAKATGRRISQPGDKQPTDIDFIFTPSTKQDIIELLISAVQHEEVGFPREVAVEMEWFEYQTSKSGTLTYGAASGHFDDRVCALGLCVLAKRGRPSDIDIARTVARIRREKMAAQHAATVLPPPDQRDLRLR